MKRKFKILAGVSVCMGVMIGSNYLIYSAAIDSNKYATAEEVSKMLNSKVLELYPVESVYMSTSGTNPSSFLGGTWVAWGSGRVPVGVNTGDGNFNTVEKTGGESTHTLTVAEMPSHTHGFTGSSVTSSGNSVTPTASFTGNTVNTGNNSVTPSASFTGESVSTGNNSATPIASFTGKAVNTGTQSANHTHAVDLTTSENGKHTHQENAMGWYNFPGTNENWWTNYNSSGVNWQNSYAQGITAPKTGEEGSHTHTVKGNTGSNSASHYHSVTAAGTVSLASTTHTHSVTASGTISLAGTSHTHSVTAAGTVSLANTSHTHTMTAAGTNGNAGGNGAHNNLQPYITCYMWKRIA